VPRREAGKSYPVGEAARLLGISLDTLRRWDRQGRIRTERDAANRRIVAAAEIDRLRRREPEHDLSARNRFRGVVREVKVEGLLAQVELEAGPFRVVSVVTREAVEELGLEPGMQATALVKATSVLLER
jgi:molybdopterin-binding protein